MARAETSPPKSGVSANLDLLRAVAVLLVLAAHICLRLRADHFSWVGAWAWGRFAVLLFFVHTSLVLMHSMERSGLDGRALLANFYVRRVFRIYPLSIFAVATALALGLCSHADGLPGLSRAPFPGFAVTATNLLLVQNLFYAKSIVGALWTLPLELQMYLFLPFLFLWIRGREMSVPLLGLWAACVAAGALQPHVHGIGRLSILPFVSNFLPGVIAYSLPLRPRLPAPLWPVFLVALIAAYTRWPGPATGWLLCLLLGLSIPSFHEITSPWLRTLSNRIATYSYGIYLSHQFCIWIAIDLLRPQSPWLRGGVLAALLVAIPPVLYHAIEKPMIDLGGRLARRYVTGASFTGDACQTSRT